MLRGSARWASLSQSIYIGMILTGRSTVAYDFQHTRPRARDLARQIPSLALSAALSTLAAQVAVAGDANGAVEYIHAAGSKAPFSTAVRVENILYLSGQIGVGPDGKLAQDFATQVRQTLTNVSDTLRQLGSSLDNVFKCTVMLTDMSRWDEFNRIYVGYFDPARLPARSALGANGLARGALLELECAAYAPRPQSAAQHAP
jgi:2-iminobutanoate/2-iminopropanoate deaminase